ncbi:hypothetical protein BT63DRAFT_424327 [Microthyrium microscopicum]|uniref:Uncharacterized protein n=1 Tax=Microthyrium microscopicum TaxID=703497 RepID=A0A6A6UDZ3_9PEZI|nr:hypothetical protein BT63DRAFT_424327 [Microthyrium microscopicum]
MIVRSKTWIPHAGESIGHCRTTTDTETVTTAQAQDESHVPSTSTSPTPSSGLVNSSPGNSSLAASATATTSPATSSSPLNENQHTLTEARGQHQHVLMSVWSPNWMEEVLPVVISSRIYPRYRKVHGALAIPKGYRLACVPADATVNPPENQDLKSLTEPSPHYQPSRVIANSFGLSKAVIALIQVSYGAYSLMAARGKYTAIHGYATCALTVIPYILMSALNCVAQCVTPNYDALFLVRSDIMDEAKERGGIFGDVVGELDQNDVKPHHESMTYTFSQLESSASHGELKATASTGEDQIKRGDLQPIECCSFSANPKIHEHDKPPRRWIHVPACTPFARKQVIAEYVVVPPKDKRGYTSSAIENDPAKRDYKKGQTSLPGKGPRWTIQIVVTLLLALCCILLKGKLSSWFKNRQSTRAQRGWTMSWFVTGVVLAPLSDHFEAMVMDWIRDTVQSAWDNPRNTNTLREAFVTLSGILVAIACMAAPAIGGLIVVGQMLRQDGNC